jgi:pilus assembly protein Flp/PilA
MAINTDNEATMFRSGTDLARRLLADESGATAIEYALIAAGVGATIAAAVWTLGADVKNNLYGKVSDVFK